MKNYQLSKKKKYFLILSLLFLTTIIFICFICALSYFTVQIDQKTPTQLTPQLKVQDITADTNQNKKLVDKGFPKNFMQGEYTDALTFKHKLIFNGHGNKLNHNEVLVQIDAISLPNECGLQITYDNDRNYDAQNKPKMTVSAGETTKEFTFKLTKTDTGTNTNNNATTTIAYQLLDLYGNPL